MKPKILFTSPCGPYQKLPLEKDPIDYFYYRNTYKQKMFQLRSFQSWHSLHFMAQNIPVASVVLENPTMKVFQEEINKGEYEIVAIGFTILLTKKVLEMAEWLKINYPKIEIVLGGYGTAIFKESFETSDKLKNIVNHICYGEGLSFMNSIISAKWKIENHHALKQDLLPAKNSFFRTRIELFKQIVIVGGLGCTYGCSFCSTSSQFNKKHISLFTGKELLNSLELQCQKYPKIKSAIIYEEDFLLNKAQVLDFIKHFKKSKLSKRPFLLTIFASTKSILNYSMQELIECGIGTIFIGVESLSEDVLLKENLTKRKGEIESVFKQLHNHGINTLGSLVIGWDSQTSEIAKADSERFISMNPTFYQVVPLHVVPGTKLWENMKTEGRISSNYKVELDGITELNFETKSFSHSDAYKLIFSTYSGLVNEGGPWPFRLFENLLNGYINLKHNSNSILSNRAHIYKALITPVFALAFVSRFFFFGKNFNKKWNLTMRKFCKEFPMYFFISIILSAFIVLILSIIYLYGYLFYLLNPIGDQPDYIRIEYKKNEN